MKQSPHLCKDGLIIDSGPSKQRFLKNGLSAIGRVLSGSLLNKARKRITLAANVRFRTVGFIKPDRHADECLVPWLP